MRLSKKIIDTITLVFFAAASALIFSACKPAIGTPWYPRSASSSSGSFIITGIQVKGAPVTAVLAETPTDDADKLKKFSEASTYTVNVPPEIAEITAEDITVTAVSSIAKMEAVTVEVTLNGGSVPLSAGRVVPVTVKIADPAGNYAVQEKVLSITQSEPYNLSLTSLKIHGKELVENGILQGTVTVPYTISAITAKDITASFTYGPHTTVIPIELGRPSIKLYENEAVELVLSVKELKGQYRAFECTVNVTRETKPDNADPALEPESIFILGALYKEGKALGVPMETEKLTEADIVAVFKDFGDIPVTLNPNPAVFGSGELMELKLSVPAQAGKYEAWETSITVKKDPTALNNPKDKNGNKKYIVKVKTITEEQSPFDYYREDSAGFSASKFDEWVLVMPSMSGIIASYKFQDGSWSGSPDSIDNIPSSIGADFKAISNVKIYRYKTRKDRGSAHGTDSELATNPHDNRFYFYRFTADASMGIKADNSMFCVDRYSKFLFYYSEPAKIKWIAGNALPTEWTDYAAASIGDHIQFGEPFYMSDPVGYVKADGSVVIYSWLKENINNAKYHAQKNTAYTKPAGRSPGQAGYSPYRDNIVTKRSEVETSVNPAYTVAVPVILAQPKPVRMKLNAADEAVFTVKTAPVPKGERISFQWYMNTTQSDQGGTAISGATGATYSPDKNTEADCYVYCAVTNTNESNGATETVTSRAVKLLIRNGSLAVDAEQPKIIKQPVGKVVPINTDGAVMLTAEAVSIDKGELTYQWYKNTADSTTGGTPIDGATDASYSGTVDTASVKTEYYYCQVTNTNNTVDGNKTASICTDTAKIKVEESYKVTFSQEGDGGYLTALHNGNSIESGTYVKKGEEVKFVVTLKPRHKVKDWVGATALGTDKVLAVLKVQDTDAAVAVSIESKMTLTITPKIENESLQSWSTADSDHFSPKYIDGVHLAHKCSVKIGSEGNPPYSWNYMFPVVDKSGLWVRVQSSDFIKIGETKAVPTNAVMNTAFDSFSDLKMSFSNYLIKANRHDYWWAEWTTGIWPPTMYPLQAIDDNSVFPLIYSETTRQWTVDKNNVQVKHSEEIPLSPEFAGTKPNPNRKISYKGVTISYDENFTLADGEEKDFVVTYTVDNHDETRSKGTVKVIYTIGWK